MFLIVTLLLASCSNSETIDLKGEWHYRLDKENNGIKDQWYTSSFDKTILLPGALRDYGIGDAPSLTTNWTGSIYDSSWFFNPAMAKYRDSSDIKFPFWLTPVTHFKGKAWYQKEITIPKSWNDRNITLFIERPHWQTKVWFDSLLMGNQNSLSTPHHYQLRTIKPGKHTLTIRIDNAIHDLDPGINSHSISDHTQGNWNGMVGELYLTSKPLNAIGQVKIVPNVKTKMAVIEVELVTIHQPSPNLISIQIEGVNHNHKLENYTQKIQSTDTLLKISIPFGEGMKTWSEFSPNLYKVTIVTSFKGKQTDTYTETFGMREFSIKGLRFAINDTVTFLRGTTECAVFPLTGYPPTDVASWDSIFSTCKSFGLNHMRFHSYCPPEAAFIAADRAGFYLQVEGPSWAKYSTSLGYGKPIDQYLMDETKRIIDAYGNHPSFVMMAYGNEPSGRYVKYLEDWVDHFKKYDSVRVFTGASTGRSWAIINNSDFIVRSPPRGLAWKNEQPESAFDYRSKTENQQRPYVTFEMGQWCAYPNFNEIKKYTGSLKAKNFELFQQDLMDKGMADQANDFLMASGKLQASCYKQEIEATLRTPNLAGFQLLSLNDFSGQGTALVGVLDAFWHEKGYINAEDFSAFCAPVVPLVRMPKFTFFNSDTLEATIELANFSGATIAQLQTKWQLIAKEGGVVAEGSTDTTNIGVGNCHQIGLISQSFNAVTEATQFTLEVTSNEHTNSWQLWVYPDNLPNPKHADVHVTDTLTTEIIEQLEKGGKVLLLAAGRVEHGKEVVHYQTPVFWNTSWFRMRPPHTIGLLIANNHTVFNNFPTDFYTDQQWWELTNRQQIMVLDSFPGGFTSIVQPIDTWFMNRKLSMLFEANVGAGKLMVCSMDLTSDSENRKVADYFYKNIVNYMASTDFNPTQTIGLDDVKELFERKERPVWKSYVNEKP